MTYDFKNEAEVKEFINNLGVEYRFGCLSEKNPEVCHLLGDYMEAIKKDYKKAGKIYKSNCDDYSFGRSCHSYGTYAFVGRGHEKDNQELAYEYFMKGCNLGVADSCFNAGLMCISSNTKMTREKDYTKGIALLNKSCDMNNHYSCYYLSGIYISGSKDNIIAKDMNSAFKYSTKACDLGNIYACSNLSLMYKKGEGVEKNEDMSEKLKKKALELQEEYNSNVTLEFQRGSEKKT